MPTRAPVPTPPHPRPALADVARALEQLDRRLVRLERGMAAALTRVPEEHRASARNLVHYVALRQHDLRALQLDLAALGLSSLGRAESCVRDSVRQASLRAHQALALAGDARATRVLARLKADEASSPSWEAASQLLHAHTRQSLGPRPADRHIYIMVTAPSAAEADRAWMAKMLRAGMNVLRVNCAHEGPEQWAAMVGALRAAEGETRRTCRLLMDLAGPKIRTGRLAGSRRIATWKPKKDELGAVVSPVAVAVGKRGAPAGDGPPPLLSLDADDFASIQRGDELWFRDARGKRRSLKVDEVGEHALVCHATKRAYVQDRVKARLLRDGARCGSVSLDVAAEAAAAIDLRAGDALVLTAKNVRGRPPRRGADGLVQEPGVVGCKPEEALEHLEVGQRVLFDDGRIDAVVEQALERRGDFLLRVVRTQRETAKLRAEKGINLPDTTTDIAAMTDDDLAALRFVVKHADVVSLSFVRRTEDVRRLHAELSRLGGDHVGVVLKIETRAGFDNLPRLLLEGLTRPPLAVMIARGDLAVEVGFERLAELQEEILWLCEAAHVPTIWATQVLDTLARTGVPSRAEVTDAAASVAAECVMLNKGPFIDEAVRVLDDILRRMERHHYKKRSLFRKLQVSTFAER